MGGSSSSIKDYQLGQSYFTNADSNLKLTLSPATSILDKKKYTVFQFAKEKGKLNDEAERYVEVGFFLLSYLAQFFILYLILYLIKTYYSLMLPYLG